MLGNHLILNEQKITPNKGKCERSMVPTGTGKTGNPGKMGRHFPVRQKSGNFVKTGKVGERSVNFTQNTGKIGKNSTGELKKYWKSQGKLSASNSESIANMAPYFKQKRTLKNTGKLQKILEKSGKFVSLKKWEPWRCSEEPALTQTHFKFLPTKLLR